MLILDSTTNGYGSNNCTKAEFVLFIQQFSVRNLARVFEILLFTLFRALADKDFTSCISNFSLEQTRATPLCYTSCHSKMITAYTELTFKSNESWSFKKTI